MATDVTALGSGTVLVIFLAGILLFQCLRKQYLNIAYVGITAMGAAVLTNFLKKYFERSRPEFESRLVDVGGFSYPSGHSLASSAIYLAIAVLAYRSTKQCLEKAVIVILFSSLIILIGLSRMYLGVHYFSDVLAGIMLGIAWTSLLTSGVLFLTPGNYQKDLGGRVAKSKK